MNMKTNIAAAVVLTVGTLAVGCGPDKSANTYPTTPDNSMTPSSSIDKMAVPAGAQLLSQGTYNQITFKVPAHSGLLYIFDADQNKVVGTTNAVESQAGQSMTMADLKNTTQGLNTNGRYQIYYAPSMPTTMPMGGMAH